MRFRIEDFVPYYLPIEDNEDNVYPNTTFYTSIPKKQEFNSLRLTEANPRLENGLYNHQEFLARFFSPITPYNRVLLFHGIGSGKCVHPDTLIQIKPGSNIPITAFWKDDPYNVVDSTGGEWYTPSSDMFVTSFDLNNDIWVQRKVIRVYREHVRTNLCSYKFENGTRLRCSKIHRLFSGDGWQSNLEAGIKVLNKQNIWTEIIESNDIYYDGYIYDLEIEETHNYVANGILTHNTCSMVSIAEAAINSLKSIPKNKKIIILVPSPTLKKNPMKELKGSCVNFKYKPEPVTAKGEILDQEQIKNKTESNIRKYYGIYTYNDFYKNTVGKTDQELIDIYTDTYIFVDEAHNIMSHSVSSSENQRNYEAMERVFHVVPGIKVILATATPMVDSPAEIVPLLNLLLPRNLKLEKKGFEKTFFDENKKIKDPEEFKRKYLFGNVSYLRSETGNVLTHNEGLPIPESNLVYTKIVSVDMDPFQSESYNEAFISDRDNTKKEGSPDDEYIISSKGLWQNSLKAGSFVFPDGSFGTKDEENFINMKINKTKKMVKGELKEFTSIESIDVSDSLKNFLTSKGADTTNEGMLTKLKTLSAKFAFTIKKILDAKERGEKVYVYTPFVNGGGAVLLGALLKLFGYSDAPKGQHTITGMDKRPRYVLLTHNTRSNIDTYTPKTSPLNCKENMYGDYVQVVIGSDVASEGVDFRHIRHVIVMVPKWNAASLDQAIGRAIRSDSHVDLPIEKRDVHIYKLAAIPIPQENVMSVDVLAYARAENKDVLIKHVERLLKESAFDCAINRDRNILSFDIDKTRACDYEACDYQCENVPAEYYKETPEAEIITDTYNLLYASKEIDKIIQIIRGLFSKKNSYTFDELMGELNTVSSIVLARALSKIIHENIEIKNRLGFANYLREEHDCYFLIDDPTGSNMHTFSYYANNPVAQKDISYNELNHLFFNKQFDLIKGLLEANVQDKANLMTVLSNCPVWLSLQIVEDAILIPEKSLLAKAILELFEKFISKKGQDIVYNIFGIKKRFTNGEWKVDETIEIEVEPAKGKKKEDLKSKLKIYGFIPFTNPPNDFKELKIVLKKVERKKIAGGVDKRAAEKGLKCSTGELSGTKILPIIYKIVKTSLANEVDPPFSDDKLKKIDISKNANFESVVKPYAIFYNKVNSLVNYFKVRRSVLFKLLNDKEVLDSLKKSYQLWVNEADILNESDEYINELLSQFGSEYIDKWYDLYVREKTDDEIAEEELTPNMREIFSRVLAVDAKNNCNELGRWLDMLELLDRVSEK